MRISLFLASGMLISCVMPMKSQNVTSSLSSSTQPRQMLMVLTPDWKSVNGKLQRFELSDQQWRAVGKPIDVVVGRAGMAWGRGLHPTSATGPQKHEGDGCSPAGIFALRRAFGSEPPGTIPGLKMPYVQCTPGLECVDDPASTHYNQLLERPKNEKPDWQSSEKMLLTGGAYRLGVVVEHNTSPAVAGKGSCVFIHIWDGPGIGTAGCTAMELQNMEKLMGWIDAEANPILVQLPQAEYARLKQAWRLPEMTVP